MLKAILNLEGAEKLQVNELKNIMGGQPVQPANCKCFCYVGGQQVNAYCFSYCPNGSIPGISEGSTGNCKFPLNPKPEL
ncbi:MULTISPECIES: hypothetical protein [Flavobacterium]|jgi:hypothetical protein|uniref:Bacteriocin n=1 Tax=Flavobacterium cupriresistens TaxID=2893885 RepID=A0ABU4RHX3_9FLAO|nr:MULTISPECIES: hypothetical protein [unclassified Flavobacterium]KLT68968.1 hypothetical protein AB674_14130 [Flavobacterium sp. ABG]MDX6191010.1 hypothetical protein [Flavobacterium sp. Fl-318]UFH43819.1 hypothetical protein LNP23_06280 [Flavobacterium sp. F-323]